MAAIRLRKDVSLKSMTLKQPSPNSKPGDWQKMRQDSGLTNMEQRNGKFSSWSLLMASATVSANGREARKLFSTNSWQIDLPSSSRFHSCFSADLGTDTEFPFLGFGVCPVNS